jgi:sensor histidine kinase regulating citrate/malate metabolism
MHKKEFTRGIGVVLVLLIVLALSALLVITNIHIDMAKMNTFDLPLAYKQINTMLFGIIAR